MARVKVHTPCMRPVNECDCLDDDDDLEPDADDVSTDPPPSVPDLLAPPVAPTAAEPIPWVGWMPSYLCRDMHQLEHDGRVYFLGITITTQLTGEEPAGGPIPVRADLGRRIADLIRADLEAERERNPR